MDHCEEYVGAASPTSYRKECGKPSTHLATNVKTGTVVALCDRHVKDYEGQPLWTVVQLVRR